MALASVATGATPATVAAAAATRPCVDCGFRTPVDVDATPSHAPRRWLTCAACGRRVCDNCYASGHPSALGCSRASRHLCQGCAYPDVAASGGSADGTDSGHGSIAAPRGERKRLRKQRLVQRRRDERALALAEAEAAEAAKAAGSGPSEPERKEAFSFTVPPHAAGADDADDEAAAAARGKVVRLDLSVSQAFPHLFPSRNSARRAVKRGDVEFNGERCIEPMRHVVPGDELRVTVTVQPSGPGVRKARTPAAAREGARVLAVMQAKGLRAAYEDDDCAIVFKPAGFHTSGHSQRTIGAVLPFLLAPSTRIDAMDPAPAHRLDSRVPGVVAVGKTRAAAAWLGTEFSERRVSKLYRAVVVGRLDAPSLASESAAATDVAARAGVRLLEPTDDVWLVSAATDGSSGGHGGSDVAAGSSGNSDTAPRPHVVQVRVDTHAETEAPASTSAGERGLYIPGGMPAGVATDHAEVPAVGSRQAQTFEVTFPIDGRACTTRARVVAFTPNVRTGWSTTVELSPHTGRMHQLRLHMAALGHPIVGDDLYHDVAAQRPGLRGVPLRTGVYAGDDASAGAGASSGDLTKSTAAGDAADDAWPPMLRGYGILLQCVALQFRLPCTPHRLVRVVTTEVNKFERMRAGCVRHWLAARALEEAA